MQFGSIGSVSGALTAFALLGCSGDRGTTNSDTCSPTRAAFTDAYAAAICDHIEPCCDSANIPFDRNQCLANMAVGVFYDARNAERFGVPYDCRAAQECLAALTKLVKSCRAFPESPSMDFDACLRVHVGTASPGDHCNVAEQCRPEAGAERVCEPADLAQSTGSVCKLRFSSLGEHETCTPDTTQPNLFVKRTCDDTRGLTCLGDPPTCERGPEIGEPCGSGSICAPDAVCAGATNTCVALPSVGAPCLEQALLTHLYRRCAGAAFCDSSGVCAAPKPDGAPCSRDDGCEGGVCAPPLGASCGDASCAPVCQARRIAEDVSCGAKPFS